MIDIPLLQVAAISATDVVTVVASHAMAIDNPMDKITPDFTIFGTEFNALWKKLFAAGWGIAILFAIGYLIRGLVSMNQHQGGGHPGQLREARSEVKTAAISLAGLAALPVIVGGILTVVG